jgi:hypothetical protein
MPLDQWKKKYLDVGSMQWASLDDQKYYVAMRKKLLAKYTDAQGKVDIRHVLREWGDEREAGAPVSKFGLKAAVMENKLEASTSSVSQTREKMQRLYRKWGYMWAHAQSLLLLFRTAPKFSLVEKFVASQLGATPSCIAIHIRHGDSCHDGAHPKKHCQPLERYRQEVKLLVEKYGKRRQIYIATDDPTVAEEVGERSTCQDPHTPRFLPYS